MSADPDKASACPKADKAIVETGLAEGDPCFEDTEKKRKKPSRSVTFPDEDQLVTQYFEPANPWHDVPTTSRAQLAAEYLEACRRHNTTPIDSVLQQIRELPENSIGGGIRAARLTLASCSLVGSAPVDALEALLRKVQFHRVELDQATVDDEGAEALFDMIEYYESANVVCISGQRQFSVRGWQAACRMIKKSAELSEMEVCEGALCASHAPILVRALRPHACRLRALCLQRVQLQHESLLSLVIALKSNTSIRELRLPDNQLSVSDAQQLGSLLRLNLHIQLLDLSNNMIQDAGTGHIADALVEQASQTPPSAAASPLSPHHFPLSYETRVGLAFLVLWNNQLTRNCAPHLSKALRASQSLCVLNIGRNALGTECVRALQCGALVSLGLQAARLTQDSAHCLAQLIAQGTKLQRLDLRDNRLGAAGLQAILNAMKDNTTLTQIDLDDPAESKTLSADDSEAATIARLTREIAAQCRRNEPPATEPERRVHRKISLTCHTACLAKTSPPASAAPLERGARAARLRSPAPSPAPSPAGSPVPHTQHTSRFSVTRVTPERENPAENASPSASPRAGYSPAPSRFKVVQVAEPPSIQVHPATQKRASRFSVTRNYDAMYNPSPTGSPSASPTPSNASPLPRAPTPGFTVTTTATVSPIPEVSVSPTPSVSISPIPSVSVSPIPSVSDSPTPIVSVSPIPSVSVSPIPRSPTPGVPVLTSDVNSVSPTPWVANVTPTVMICGFSTPGVNSCATTEVQTALSTVSVQSCAASTGISSSVSPTGIALTPISDVSTSATVIISPVMTCASPTISTCVTPIKAMTNVSPTDTSNTSSGPEFVTVETGVPPSLASDAKQFNEKDYIESNLSTCIKFGMNTVSEVHANKTSTKHNISDRNRSLQKCDIISVTEMNLLSTGTEVECRNDSVTVQSNIASTIQTMPSSDTMTGVCGMVSLSGTPIGSTSLGPIADSLGPVKSVSQCLKDSEQFKIDPIVAPNIGYDNLGNIETCLGIDRSQLEPKLGPASAPKCVFAPKSVVNTRFSISPIPDNFGVFSHKDSNIPRGDIGNIAKPVAIGSQTNIATGVQAYTDKPTNVEADILMKIAEFTEKMTPKVVEIEPKAMPVDLVKQDIGQYDIENKKISESMTSIGRPVSVITAPISVVTNILEIDVSSKIEYDANETEFLEKTFNDPKLPLDYKNMHTETSNITKLREQTKLEEQDLGIDIKNIPSTESKHILSTIEADKYKEVIDNIGIKHILKEELRPTEIKPELLKNIAKQTIIEEVETSKSDVIVDSYLKDRKPTDSRLDSDRDISDTKKSGTSDESVKNKTYSDVVKSDPKYKDKSEQLTHKEEISDSVLKTETKLVKNSVEMSDSDKLDVQIEVTVKKESMQDAAKVHSDQNKDFINIDDIIIKKDGKTMKQIEEITQDLGNLIQEMKHMSSKSRKVKSDCTVDLVSVDTNKVPGKFNTDVVLKKNKSESSLDSPDLEVSRLMNKKLIGSPFCDSSSSLEISGSSMESLNAIENQHSICHVISKPVVIQESVESDTELDRRKDVPLSTESSMESGSEVTPVNSGNFLNMSVSSNESVSPILFGMKKKIHDSLSSLEASMSSLDSGRPEKVMVTSADSGIEYSLQHQTENKEDNSSNEGTLTHNSSLNETVKKTDQETLTSPKRASSLLDVPALKTKGLDRMRKISWVAPSSSFHIPRVDTEKMEKPSHLEKLLSLFQHPTSLFSRGPQSDEERKSASNTPPRKDSSLTSSFWSWGSTIEKEKEDKDDSSEATDSTLSERVQVSFVDESFSKKLDSKTPSTDTDNTLSEFQSFPIQAADSEKDNVTDKTTDENLVQKCLGLSLTDKAGSNGNRDTPRASDMTDLNKPNDLNRNYEVASDNKHAGDVENKSENKVIIDKEEVRLEPIRPRSFAAVLKSSGSENSLDKQPSPDSGQPVNKLPSKVIRGIKENISPENTLTSSMTNTKTLALELTGQVKNQPVVNTVWELTNPSLEKSEDLAPIATIDETCDEAADNTVNIRLEFIDDVKTDEKDTSIDSGVTLETAEKDKIITVTRGLENIDLGKDALSYLIYESQDFEPDTEHSVAAPPKVEEGSLAQELKDAEIKEMLDLSPELVIDDALDVFAAKETVGLKASPVIPERAKLKKSNSLEDLSQRSEENQKISPKTKTIAFKVPETTSPRDIPERRPKLRTMSGSSPKSLPESLNKPCPLTKMDTALKKRKKVSSLGKIAKDSLLALNMSEEEIAEYRKSYVTSVESLRSLESVSEDANSQSGTSVDSRCRSCLRTSQESLMSLDSITDDCKCGNECEKAGRSLR